MTYKIISNLNLTFKRTTELENLNLKEILDYAIINTTKDYINVSVIDWETTNISQKLNKVIATVKVEWNAHTESIVKGIEISKKVKLKYEDFECTILDKNLLSSKTEVIEVDLRDF